MGFGGSGLTLDVFKEGAAVFHQAFSNDAAADAFFSDHVIDLGDWSTGVSGSLDVDVRLTEQVSGSANGYGADFLLGVQAPSEQAPNAGLPVHWWRGTA